MEEIPSQLRELAKAYTNAWCSQNAASVAGFYSSDGRLTINDGPPSTGRAAITKAGQDFTTSFPDMKVVMDNLTLEGEQATYHWTLQGTNTGPGGTGKRVCIRGFEQWRIGADGLIAQSTGHFDSAEYERQIQQGAGEPQ